MENRPFIVFQEDNENNNVDENSNDHQFHEFANIHQQYDQQIYHQLENQHLNNQRADDEQTNRERLYQRLNGRHNSNDEVDRNSPNQQHQQLRNSDRYSSNFPEDLTRPDVTSPHGTSRHRLWLTGRSSITHQSSEEIKAEAEELFCNFAIEEFRSQNVETHHLGLPAARPLLTNPIWAKAGQDLRQLADAFSKSPQREVLRRKAHDVNMSSISMDNFFHLCSELFQGSDGITQERIVVLFTFISDIAIQHVRIRGQQFIERLMNWSLRFIMDQICAWVHKNGGWGVVLSGGADLLLKMSLSVLALLGIVALGVYIVKSVKDS